MATDEVLARPESSVASDSGESHAQFVPAPALDPTFGVYFGRMIRIVGDIISPIVPLEDYDALR